MNQDQFQLPRSITNQLLHLAQLSPTEEICGLIGSKQGIVSTCYPIKNIDNQPKTHFQLDPKQQINALATMRENNEALFAIYHSHPTAPAVPSAKDLELMTYPEALYIIISLNTKGVLELRGFNIIDHAFREVSLRLSSMS